MNQGVHRALWVLLCSASFGAHAELPTPPVEPVAPKSATKAVPSDASASSPAPESSFETHDTKMTLGEAETRLERDSLDILAGRLGIRAAEGAAEQASLWSNPNLQLEQNVYNWKTGHYFDMSRTGNTEVQLQQLVTLAGKHKARRRLAELDLDTAKLSFEDLRRTLRFKLRTTFYRVFLQRRVLALFEKSLQSLNKTIGSAEKAYEKRGLLLSEVLRLKALRTQLESDRLDIHHDIASAQSDLRTLLFPAPQPGLRIVPDIDPATWARLVPPASVDSVYETARAQRPDIKALEVALRHEERNADLQRSLAIPDLTVGMRYSRAGSYIPEYYALTLGLNIPIFDTNQGGVRSAEAQVSIREANLKRALADLRNDIEASFESAWEAERAFRRSDPDFINQYEFLVEKMTLNYEQRNIGIIAFADFYESFRTSMLQQTSMTLRRLMALEELDLEAGVPVVIEVHPEKKDGR